MLTDSLLRINTTWRISDFYTAKSLLQAVEEYPPHLVITAQDLPQYSGTEVLDGVRALAPQTIRILIATDTFRPHKLASAHQYLARPYNPIDFQQRILSAIDAQEHLQNPDLTNLVTALQSFPVIPHVQAQLLRQLDNDNVNMVDVACQLQQDGGILTKVIQMANSPLFSAGDTVSDGQDALLLLGTNQIKSLLLSLHVFRTYDALSFPIMPIKAIWQHCWDTANVAKNLCKLSGNTDDISAAFFASLVHNLGRLILIENQASRYHKTCLCARDMHIPLYQAEITEFGVQSSELTGFMLRLWGIDSNIIQAVLHHNQPVNNSSHKLTILLHAASIIARYKTAPDKFACPTLDWDLLDKADLSNAVRQLPDFDRIEKDQALLKETN